MHEVAKVLNISMFNDHSFIHQHAFRRCQLGSRTVPGAGNPALKKLQAIDEQRHKKMLSAVGGTAELRALLL